MKKITLEKPLVSAIIPTYNIGKTAIECIDSIFKQDYKNLEVIVIDNGTDGTFEKAKKKYPSIKGHISKKNLGSTGGQNAGLKLTKGEYIWFIDHDNIMNKNMLSELIKVLEMDKKIAAVTPKIFLWEPRNIIWSAGGSVNMLTGINITREGPDTGQFEKVEEVDIPTANFLVRRTIIDKIGFYDNVYWLTYEDADWAARVKRAGYKIFYAPKAICYHKFPYLDKRAGKKRWLDRAFYTARNKIIFMRKNSPYWWLFALSYPAWFLLYTYQAIRYKHKHALVNFYRGMYDGFKFAFFQYTHDKN